MSSRSNGPPRGVGDSLTWSASFLVVSELLSSCSRSCSPPRAHRLVVKGVEMVRDDLVGLGDRGRLTRRRAVITLADGLGPRVPRWRADRDRVTHHSLSILPLAFSITAVDFDSFGRRFPTRAGFVIASSRIRTGVRSTISVLITLPSRPGRESEVFAIQTASYQGTPSGSSTQPAWTNSR